MSEVIQLTFKCAIVSSTTTNIFLGNRDRHLSDVTMKGREYMCYIWVEKTAASICLRAAWTRPKYAVAGTSDYICSRKYQ